MDEQQPVSDECNAKGCRYLINFWCLDVEGKLYHVACAERLRAIGILPKYDFMAAMRYLTDYPV